MSISVTRLQIIKSPQKKKTILQWLRFVEADSSLHHDRLKSLKQVVTVPLPNALQHVLVRVKGTPR